MCLGIPGKIIEINPQNGIPMGKVDFGGVIREVCFAALPEARIGEYAIIHAGFALSILSEEEAQATLQALQEIADLNDELDPEADCGETLR